MTSGTTSTPDLDARLARYVEDLRARGAIRSDAVHTAFAGLQARLRVLTASWLDNGRPDLEHWNTALVERPGLPAPLLTPGRWWLAVDGSR